MVAPWIKRRRLANAKAARAAVAAVPTKSAAPKENVEKKKVAKAAVAAVPTKSAAPKENVEKKKVAKAPLKKNTPRKSSKKAASGRPPTED